jgi:hypothetical protein
MENLSAAGLVRNATGCFQPAIGLAAPIFHVCISLDRPVHRKCFASPYQPAARLQSRVNHRTG